MRKKESERREGGKGRQKKDHRWRGEIEVEGHRKENREGRGETVEREDRNRENERLRSEWNVGDGREKGPAQCF